MMDKNILKNLAEGVANSTPTKELLAQLDEKMLQAEAEELAKNPEWVPEVLRALFGESIPTDQSFYDRVAKFARPFGFGDPSEKLIATIWQRAIANLEMQDRISLLDHLPKAENNDFWRMLGAFPFFLPQAHMPPKFLASFLPTMGEKIGADLGGGPFYQAVEAFSVQAPREANELLNLFMAQELSEIASHIASILLGGLRTAARNSKIDSDIVDRVDESLINSESTNKRIIYHRSWSTSFSQGVVPIEELSQRLDLMISGSEKEQNEAFGVIRTCVATRRRDESFATFAFGWIMDHLAAATSSWAKYLIVDATWLLISPDPKNPQINQYESAKTILTTVQPISSKDLGTWRQLEYVLVEVIHRDKDKFVELLASIYRANPKVVSELFEAGKLEYIESEMKIAKIEGAVYSLLFSSDDLLRSLGMTLFRLDIVKFEGAQIPPGLSPDIRTLRNALLEFTRRPMLGGETCDFLLAMLPLAEKVDNPFKNDFKREMVLQAINYPGACLSEWKKLVNKSDFLEEVIKSADQYFEKLNTTKVSPANSFSFSDFNDAVNRGMRRRSRDINEGVEEKSVMMKFVTKVNVLYGDRWATSIDGNIGEPTGFGQISHYAEYPRLEEIDPEGMAMKRLEAVRKLAELRRGSTSN